MAEILLMFSFGVAHPDDPFFWLLSRFPKVNKLKFGKAKKRAENEFFKSNMDALAVLSIWDTGFYAIIEIHIIKIVQQTLGKTLNIGKQLTFILPFQYFCDMMHDCCKHETSSCQPRRASRVNSKIWEGGLPSIVASSTEMDPPLR